LKQYKQKGVNSPLQTAKGKDMDFLDKMLGDLIKPPKHKTQIEWEKNNKKYYQRLRRLCQKHGITYKRDMSYWDFSKPIGTIGENENIFSYQDAFFYVKEYFEKDRA